MIYLKSNLDRIFIGLIPYRLYYLWASWQSKILMEKIISERAIKRRIYWVNEIKKLRGNFGDDYTRLENELSAEIKKEGLTALIDHLRLCGNIPESYGHDSSEEKLYSKYTDCL